MAVRRIFITPEQADAALKAHGTIGAAAAYLGVSRSTTRRLLAEYTTTPGGKAHAAREAAARDNRRAQRRPARVEAMRLSGHWQDAAECTDPEVKRANFFPTSNSGRGGGPGVAEAKRVCADCPVIDLCLAADDLDPLPHGVVAGLTADEREARRAERERAERGAA